MNERLEAIKSSILDSLDKAKTALNNKEVAVESLKVSEIPGYIRQIELNKIKLTVTCSEFDSGTIKATKDGKERTGTVQDGQCIIMLPSTGTWHIEHDLGDYVETEVNGDTSVELVKKKVTFSEGECSEEKITVHVDSVTGNNSNDNFIRVKKNGVTIEVQAQLVGSDIEITNFEYEEGATYTIEYVIKDEVRGSVEVEMVVTPKESVKLKAEFIGTGMENEIGILNSCSNVTKMIFTDEKAPSDVTTYDKSANEDNSVVAWFKDDTLYISSQVKGARIEMFESYYNKYNDYLTLFKYSKGNPSYSFSQLNEVDLKNIDTSKITNMESFFGSDNLQNIKNLDKLDTSNVENMKEMFTYTKITDLDLSSFDFSKVQTIYMMFSNCKNLNNITFGSIKAEKLTNAKMMFESCTSLQNIDLSDFETPNLEDITQMFYGCTQLQNVIFGPNFNTGNVTNMDGLFLGCEKIQKIDMSHFTIKGSDVIADNMFHDCYQLTTIYAQEWNNSGISSSNSKNMFVSCSQLPNYNSRNTDISMAKWKENGGYFTNPAEKG